MVLAWARVGDGQLDSNLGWIYTIIINTEKTIHLHRSAVRIKKTCRHGNTPLHEETVQQHWDSPHQAVVQEPKQWMRISLWLLEIRLSLGLISNAVRLNLNKAGSHSHLLWVRICISNFSSPVNSQAIGHSNLWKDKMYFKLQWLCYDSWCSFEIWMKMPTHLDSESSCPRKFLL